MDELAGLLSPPPANNGMLPPSDNIDDRRGLLARISPAELLFMFQHYIDPAGHRFQPRAETYFPRPTPYDADISAAVSKIQFGRQLAHNEQAERNRQILDAFANTPDANLAAPINIGAWRPGK